ncbi:hypothetical protein BGX26_007230, partial [Mortierella sp. AD094]
MSHASTKPTALPDHNQPSIAPDDSQESAPFTQTVNSHFQESRSDTQRVDPTIASGDESSSVPPAPPTLFTPTVDDPLAFLSLRKAEPIPPVPSKDELNMALVGTHNSRTLCRHLEYLRTCYSAQSVMYHCRSYGLFNEPRVLPLVPHVDEEDEVCARRFNDMAIKVDGKIQGLKRSASFMEGSLESDRVYRASVEMARGDDQRRESKKVRKETTPSPKKTNSSPSGSSVTIPSERSLSALSSLRPFGFQPASSSAPVSAARAATSSLISALISSTRTTTSVDRSAVATPNRFDPPSHMSLTSDRKPCWYCFAPDSPAKKKTRNYHPESVCPQYRINQDGTN